MQSFNSLPSDCMEPWKSKIDAVVKKHLIEIRGFDAMTPPAWPCHLPFTYVTLPEDRLLAVVDRKALLVAKDFSDVGFRVMPAHRRMGNAAYRLFLQELSDIGGIIEDENPCDRYLPRLRYQNLESPQLDFSKYDAGVFFHPWRYTSVIAVIIEKTQIGRAYELLNSVLEFADHKECPLDDWKLLAFAGDELSLLIGEQGAKTYWLAQYVLENRMNVTGWSRRATRSLACLQDPPYEKQDWWNQGVYQRYLVDDSREAEEKFRKEIVAQVDQINDQLRRVICAPDVDDDAFLNPETGEWESQY